MALYKINRWYWPRRAEKKRYRDAERNIRELDQAIRAERERMARLALVAPTPVAPAVNPEKQWDHIPRIAFDLDTQLEFGGSRYHTNYVTPEEADDFGIKPGLYITDKREGPELIGSSDQKRFFIPYDQLIKR